LPVSGKRVGRELLREGCRVKNRSIILVTPVVYIPGPRYKKIQEKQRAIMKGELRSVQQKYVLRTGTRARTFQAKDGSDSESLGRF